MQCGPFQRPDGQEAGSAGGPDSEGEQLQMLQQNFQPDKDEHHATEQLGLGLITRAECVANLYARRRGAMPVMLLAMGLGITGMFGGGASQDLAAYCIPLYNSVQCMAGVFSFSVLPAGVGITVGVNGLVTLAGVFVLAKMFNSEKIIFAR